MLAYVGYEPGTDSVMIAFRGTALLSILDWISDLNFFQTAGICPGCEVHEGFLAAYLSIRDDFMVYVHAVKAQYPDSDVVLSGHSLGGALAYLAAGQSFARSCFFCLAFRFSPWSTCSLPICVCAAVCSRFVDQRGHQRDALVHVRPAARRQRRVRRHLGADLRGKRNFLPRHARTRSCGTRTGQLRMLASYWRTGPVGSLHHCCLFVAVPLCCLSCIVCVQPHVPAKIQNFVHPPTEVYYDGKN